MKEASNEVPTSRPHNQGSEFFTLPTVTVAEEFSQRISLKKLHRRTYNQQPISQLKSLAEYWLINSIRNETGIIIPQGYSHE
jgi:hypothetical protein